MLVQASQEVCTAGNGVVSRHFDFQGGQQIFFVQPILADTQRFRRRVNGLGFLQCPRGTFRDIFEIKSRDIDTASQAAKSIRVGKISLNKGAHCSGTGIGRWIQESKFQPQWNTGQAHHSPKLAGAEYSHSAPTREQSFCG